MALQDMPWACGGRLCQAGIEGLPVTGVPIHLALPGQAAHSMYACECLSTGTLAQQTG